MRKIKGAIDRIIQDLGVILSEIERISSGVDASQSVDDSNESFELAGRSVSDE